MRGTWSFLLVLVCVPLLGCSWARRMQHHRGATVAAQPALSAAGHTACLAHAEGAQCWGRAMNGRAGVPPGLEEATHVVAASLGRGDRVCGVQPEGTVACVGPDETLVAVPGLDGAVELVSDGRKLCARTSDGRVLCAYGDGRPPRELEELRGSRRLVAGAQLCGVARDGALKCTTLHGVEPVADGEQALRVRDVAMAGNIACGLVADGRVACKCIDCQAWTPWHRVDAVASHVAVGANGYCVVTREHHVVCNGLSMAGERGDGTLDASEGEAQVAIDADITEVAAGAGFYCATDDTRVWCWGGAVDGGTGPGTDHRETVTTIPGAASLSVHDDLICVTTEDGGVQCFGGQAPDLRHALRPYAQPAALTCSQPVTAAQVSQRAVWALLPGGVPAHSAVCNDLFGVAPPQGATALAGVAETALVVVGGRVLRFDAEGAWLPVPLEPGSDAISVSASPIRSCAAQASGRVACWNARDPDHTVAYLPVTDATEVCAANTLTCVRHTNDHVTCDGLPRGVDVSPLTGTTQLACDTRHVCGLRGDDVVCVSANAMLSPLLAPTEVRL